VAGFEVPGDTMPFRVGPRHCGQSAGSAAEPIVVIVNQTRKATFFIVFYPSVAV